MILKTLFFLLLIAIPSGVLFRLNPSSSVFIYPIDIVSLLIFLYYVFNFYRRQEIKDSSVAKAFGIFAVSSFVSLLLNSTNLSGYSFFVSFSYLLRYVAFFSIFLSASLLDSQFKKRYLTYLSISASVFVLLGLFQYVLYPDLRNLTYLGWDEHLYRLFSTFLDPNFAGAFFVLILFLFIYKIQSNNKLAFRLIYLLIVFLTLASILLTYSRSSYIALFTSSIVYFVFLGKKKISALFLIVFVLGIFLIPHDLKSEGVNLFRTASITARQESYKTAIKVFNRNPLFGVGFNSFRYAQNQYGFLNDKKWEVTNAGAGVPNSYLFILATTGIIGSMFYLNFWTVLIRDIFKNNDKKTKALVLATLTAIFVQSLFENILFYSFIAAYLFLLLGIVKRRDTT